MRCCANKDAFPIPNFRWSSDLSSKQRNYTSESKENDHILERWFNLINHGCSHLLVDGKNAEFLNYSASCFASNTGEWMNITRKLLAIEYVRKRVLETPIRDIEMELLTTDYRHMPNGIDLNERFILRCCANEDAFPTPRFQWHTLNDLYRTNWTRLSETHNRQLEMEFKRKVLLEI